jgi:hypothetical protein
MAAGSTLAGEAAPGDGASEAPAGAASMGGASVAATLAGGPATERAVGASAGGQKRHMPASPAATSRAMAAAAAATPVLDQRRTRSPSPATSRAARRTVRALIVRAPSAKAPSRARSQITLISRGTPREARWTAWSAPGSNSVMRCPAICTRRQT